ncbi:MAG: hypothetical protein AB7U20_09810 [Planctomycetaceae bacterium]
MDTAAPATAAAESMDGDVEVRPKSFVGFISAQRILVVSVELVLDFQIDVQHELHRWVARPATVRCRRHKMIRTQAAVD